MIGLAPKPPRIRRAKEPKLWTYDELVAKFPESTQPMELWNGELIMPPTPDSDHQRSTFDFAIALRNWVDRHKLGEVFIAPFDMVLAPRQVTQPDVLFISNERAHLVRKTLKGAADLVVEVISPNSHERDRIKKRDLYEQHGVKEYWLLDREGATVEVLYLTKDRYQLVGRWRAGEIAKSKLLSGFEVRVSDVLRLSS
jgi:Uma2 family endonuclease